MSVDSKIPVVAMGGGHGLAATLTALREITTDITALVTVADDGGSSGRLRAEFGVMPPGDLRMALAALCSDDEWGRGWARVLQHRFSSAGDLDGHSVGNLLLTALWEIHEDPVVGLAKVAELLRVVGRVLPMSSQPLEIQAQVRTRVGSGEKIEEKIETVRGQSAVALARGVIDHVHLIPDSPPTHPEALAAIERAEWVTLGPGSWYSSVLPHLLLPQTRAALAHTKARKLLLLNLTSPYPGDEAAQIGAQGRLAFLRQHAPEVPFDVILADPSILTNELVEYVATLGARLEVRDLAHAPTSDQHDPKKVVSALREIMAKA
ncbi:MAG: uridine diphosphate-N-acetylglucosamine-binding protein YvcK [Actinomycetota bacterium]